MAITSRGLNSKFSINVTTGKSSDGGNAAPGSVWLARTISGSLTDLTHGRGLNDRYKIDRDGGGTQSQTWTFWDEPAQAAGTTITYTLRFARISGSSTFYLLSAYGMGAMTIQEIAV